MNNTTGCRHGGTRIVNHRSSRRGSIYCNIGWTGELASIHCHRKGALCLCLCNGSCSNICYSGVADCSHKIGCTTSKANGIEGGVNTIADLHIGKSKLAYIKASGTGSIYTQRAYKGKCSQVTALCVKSIGSKIDIIQSSSGAKRSIIAVGNICNGGCAWV